MSKKIICDKCGHSEDMIKYYGWNAPTKDMYSRHPKPKWFSVELGDLKDLCETCHNEYQEYLKQFKGSKNV